MFPIIGLTSPYVFIKYGVLANIVWVLWGKPQLSTQGLLPPALTAWVSFICAMISGNTRRSPDSIQNIFSKGLAKGRDVNGKNQKGKKSKILWSVILKLKCLYFKGNLPVLVILEMHRITFLWSQFSVYTYNCLMKWPHLQISSKNSDGD